MADPGAPPIGMPAPAGNLLSAIQAQHNRVRRPCQVCGRESAVWGLGVQCCDSHYDYDLGRPREGSHG